MKPSNAGQIVRIHLENFMSFDRIEIRPGNNLNLIIGPNGTGKSSIVCAVLLGLGGKLKTLGRADQFGSYVKSGCDECCIEVELYEPENRNVVIKRKILSNNQSEFIVNGKISTSVKINEIRKKYNIEIDNLCTFLPQEKVQDFAKLNPQQLLDQTQRTVGHGNLVQLLEELKKLQSKIIEQEKRNASIQDELDNERQKNDRLKDKVKCFKEKQSLCEKLEALKQKKGWLCFEEEIKNKKEVEKDFKLAEKVYNSTKQEIVKFDKKLLDLEKNLFSCQNKLAEAKKDEAGKKQAWKEWVKRAERRIEKLEDLKNTMQQKLHEEENKRKEQLKYKGNIEKLTNDLKALDESIGSEAELRCKKEEVDEQLKNIHAEDARLTQLSVKLEEEVNTLTQELRNTKGEYERLQKRRNIRVEYLKRREPDVYHTIQWLEKNRHLFQSRIYNPMLLELDVPNSKMAKYVEALVRYKDLISFTCTNPDDLNLFIHKLRTELKLKINAICSDECDNSQYFPEVPISHLKPYGFHSYVKDLVKGPEDIIRFLCKTYGMHCVPVGDDNVKANCGKVPKNISFFYSENDVFSVKYSVYSGEKSISVKKLDEPKYFTESLDEGRMQILMDRQKDLQLKVKSKQEERNGVDERINKIRAKLAEVKKKNSQLSTSVEERQQIQKNLNKALTSYNCIKETLKDPGEIERETEAEKETLKKEIEKSLKEIKRASGEAEKTKLNRQECELKNNIETFEKNQLQEAKIQCTEELSRKEALLREMKDHLRAAELNCANLKDKAKQLTENISKGDPEFDRFQKKFDKLPEKLDDIEREIEDTQTKADFLQGGNHLILQDYEKREELITQLTDSLENSKKSLKKKRAELNLKQDEWLNPVSELVSKINENFGRFFEAMGCAGEVSLIGGENKSDFDQYGIKILVKFRDGMPLQELGRYFQSGGERAVATAVFMLSLQELTSVPFRFVDEINQGMDLENERRILQLIVRVTASKRSNQYFFITPKLLPDLECSKTMTVLCIHNGPFAIPDAEWNLDKFLNKTSESGVEDEEEEDDIEDENLE